MRRNRWLWKCVASVMLVGVGGWKLAEASTPEPPNVEPALRKPGLLGPMWIPNRGQVDGRILFYTNTFAGTVAVLGDGRVMYTLRQAEHIATSRDKGRSKIAHRVPVRLWTVYEQLNGGRIEPRGLGETSTVVNWLRGSDPSSWRLNLPSYAAVDLGEVWSGVRVELRVNERDVERIFTVLPSTPVDSIRIEFQGLRDLSVAPDGSLVGDTGLGRLRWSPPAAYQTIEGRQRFVPIRYRVSGRNQVTFVTEAYDRTQPLVIDPYLSATFVGGTQDDAAFAVVRASVMGEGTFFFIAGQTASPVFPASSWTPGFQGTAIGAVDAFVARVEGTSPSTLNRVTFFGGSADDAAFALTTDGDPASYVYVAGSTASNDLPATASRAQPSYGGGSSDAFVARFTPDLSSVVATYLGGSAADNVGGSVFAGGSVIVVGSTDSDGFPGSTGGGQPLRAGGVDGFLSKLAADLTVVQQSTYLGGSGNDFLTSLFIDGTDVYVGGYSTSNDFPAVASGAQSSLAGSSDGVVTALPLSLTAPPTQSTYFGGAGAEQLEQISVSGAYMFAVGRTDSASLPGTSGRLQDTHGGGPTDGFVLRVDKTLTSGLIASFFGGGGDDQFNAIDVLGGDVVAVGFSGSPTLPGLGNALQPLPGGNLDGVIAVFSNDLTSVQTSFFGGSQPDALYAVKGFTEPSGSARMVVVGESRSDDIPGLDGAAQPVREGQADALLADLPVPPLFQCPQQPVSGCVVPVKASVTIQDRTVAGPDPDARDKLVWNWKGTATGGSYQDFGNPMIGGRTDYLLCVYDSSGLIDQLKVSLLVKRGGTCGGSGQACWKKVPKRGAQTGYLFRDPTLAQSGVARVLLRQAPTGVDKDVIKVSARGAGIALPGPVNSSQYASVDQTFRVQLLRNDGRRCWQAVWPQAGVKRNTATLFRAVCGGAGQPPC